MDALWANKFFDLLLVSLLTSDLRLVDTGILKDPKRD
jgi:hypothetical protein